jgi:serine/threonine protein kinase
MALTSGTKLGPYEILSPLGAGGMGEVYRARDARLNRDVAIKVLLAAFARDPERLRRFQQEAQAVAALNHPNILAVHGRAALVVTGPADSRNYHVGLLAALPVGGLPATGGIKVGKMMRPRATS